MHSNLSSYFLSFQSGLIIINNNNFLDESKSTAVHLHRLLCLSESSEKEGCSWWRGRDGNDSTLGDGAELDVGNVAVGG